MIKPTTTESTSDGKPIARANKTDVKAWAVRMGWIAMSDSDEMTVYLTPTDNVRVIHYSGDTAYLRDPKNIK